MNDSKKMEKVREEAIVKTKNQLWTEGIRGEQRSEVRAIQIVDQIFADPDILIKSDNQELPKSPLEEIQGGSPQYEPEYYIGYEIAQQDMLKQNRPRMIKT